MLLVFVLIYDPMETLRSHATVMSVRRQDTFLFPIFKLKASHCSSF